MEGDKNSKLFYAYTAQIRNSNSIERLAKDKGEFYETEEEMEEEIAYYYI